MRRAVEARGVMNAGGALKVRRQRLGRPRARDHDDVSVGDQRSGRSGGARACGADHPDDLGISHDGLCGGLATVGGAEIVETLTHRDREALDVAVVGNSRHNRILMRDTDEREITRDRVERADLNLFAAVNNNDGLARRLFTSAAAPGTAQTKRLVLTPQRRLPIQIITSDVITRLTRIPQRIQLRIIPIRTRTRTKQATRTATVLLSKRLVLTPQRRLPVQIITGDVITRLARIPQRIQLRIIPIRTRTRTKQVIVRPAADEHKILERQFPKALQPRWRHLIGVRGQRVEIA